MLYGETYIKFDVKKNKEYIFSRESYMSRETLENDIGKTFIDFLSDSESIINIIKDEISKNFYKNDKLGDLKDIHTITKFHLEKLNPFFKHFDFDAFIENYVKNLKNKNNAKIRDFLEKIADFDKDIKYYNSQEYYNYLLEDKISFYKEYDSKKDVHVSSYLEKSQKEVHKSIQKFIKAYGYYPSFNSCNKLYNKNSNHIKAMKIININEKEIYDAHKKEIEAEIEADINRDVRQAKHFCNTYKKYVKKYIKLNSQNIENVFNEYIERLNFWISFSKYILINFHNLLSEKYDRNYSATQRLLDSLLHVQRTYFSENIFELPKSNITLKLYNNNEEMDLYDFLKRNRSELVHNNSNLLNKLNSYKSELVQEFHIDSIEDFISVSLMQILQNNITIRKCENCDKLFISVNKSNEKYCTYKYKGNKTCRDLSYAIHLQKDELSNILRKKYRTENAKKNRYNHIPNIEEKFQTWYAKAKEQKSLCEKGKITYDEFNKWFIENKKWF